MSLFTLSSCAHVYFMSQEESSTVEDKVSKSNKISQNFASSGSFVISYPLQKLIEESKNKTSEKAHNSSVNKLALSEKDNNDSNPVGYAKFAPLLGFIPLHSSFQPAENELWLEIDRQKSTLVLYKGKDKIKEVNTEGKVNLTPGQYPLQHKQKSPLWYAPDEYFERRQLRVPPRGDHFRYRRGALGQFALYPTMDFIIHCGPMMSDELGGLRINPSEMSEIFSLLPIGASIVVK